jgi:thymidylate synthase
MKQYLDIVRNILQTGTPKNPVRVGSDGKVEKVENETIGLPNIFFSHDMADGFPLLTTKKVHFHSVAVELEGFLKGITDKSWYQERKCSIWNEWANDDACRDFYEKNYRQPYLRDKAAGLGDHIDDFGLVPYPEVKTMIAKSVSDLGPVYGYQWRNFGQQYGSKELVADDHDWTFQSNGLKHGHDQLKDVLNTLRDNPTDRRMVISAWNPNQKHIMALPPCHLMWIVTVYNGKVNLHWTQRSVCTGLGLCFNIASYGLLLTMLAKHANLEIGNLSGSLIDCHIYEDHIAPLSEQIKRQPKQLPQIQIDNNNDDDKYPFDLLRWTHKNYKLIDYDYHPRIKMNVTV